MKTKIALFLIVLGTLAVPVEHASAGSKFKLLHSFGGPADGNNPYGSPMLDAKGNLYGVTSGGPGEYGNGTVYELAPQANGTWKETILHSFQDGNDGAIPQGALVLDSVHDLYGTLVGDVGDSYGIFELSRGSGGWTNTHIYTDAAGPGLLIDSLGNLYGNMTPSQYGYAAIGELSPGTDGWNYTALYSFCSQQGCPDGWGPWAPPMLDGHGNMFGTTYYGGNASKLCWRYTSGCGVIFEMTPNGDGTWTYSVLYRFAAYQNDGQSPAAGLIMDKAGNFYGSTAAGGPYGREQGGYGNGTVFELSFINGKWKKTDLYDFPDCNIGCNPGWEMAFDKAGNLYGAADGGGLPDCDGYQCGVIYKLSPQKSGKWKYSVVHKLTGLEGENPWGLAIDRKGNLYGTTFMFGKYNAGTAFEIIP
jgi:uncharacterized repeat protein (TIGR03803 family)